MSGIERILARAKGYAVAAWRWLWPLLPSAVALAPVGRRARPVIVAPDGEAQFEFRKGLLDQLDSYFALLRRMKKADREAYDLYSRIGIHLVARGHMEHPAGLSAWWRQTRPSIGAVAISDISTAEHFEEQNKRWWQAKLVYWDRYAPGKAPAEVQRSTGDIYRVTIYWDNRKRGAPTQFALAITPTGEVTVLRTRQSEVVTIRSKRRGGDASFTRQRWAYGEFFDGWARQVGLDPAGHLASLFFDAAALYERVNHSIIRVDVRKGDLHGLFSIDVTRTPYFFKDRDLVVNENGRRRPIFHIVRAHRRLNGVVRTHFRGARSFTWNGYVIQITVPGRDHVLIPEFNVAGSDEEKYDGPASDRLGAAEVGAWLRGHVDGKPVSPGSLPES